LDCPAVIQDAPRTALHPLSNIYALQEVAQQSRIRHKEDFILAFSPVIAEATAIAYKGAPSELQGKIRRVVDVWKDRTIFEVPIQEAIETRLGGRLHPQRFHSTG
jgi:regulator of Ty1 transposition protein 103